MGCWNETCGVTQLPINAGDPVRLFVLVNKEHWKGKMPGGGWSYSNDLWGPLGAPVQGTYDDYGGIEDIVHNQDTELLLSRIKEGFVPFEDKYEKISTVEEMTLEDALSYIERDNGKYKLPAMHEQTLGVMFVHEDVYQSMINFDHIEADFGDKNYFYKPLSQIYKSQLEKWYVDTAQQYAEALKEKDPVTSVALMRMQMILMDVSFFHDYHENGLKYYKNALLELAKQNAPYENEKVQLLSNSVINILRFSNAMSMARKSWMPQSGKGSQENSLEIYQAIMSGANKVIAARREYEKENDINSDVDENGYTPYMIEHNLKQSREANGNKE